MSKELKNEKEPINLVTDEILAELAEEKKYNAKMFNKMEVNKSNLVLTLLSRITGKLLYRLKIKLVVTWDDKVLFEYVIPKN